MTLLPQSNSAEYHDAHLSFARAAIVEAAANRQPILDLLKTYTADVSLAERGRMAGAVVDAIQEQERLRSVARNARAAMATARAWLTPGMKAGVADAKAILNDGIAVADEALGIVDQ